MKHLEDASKELISHLIFALNHSMDLKKEGVDPMIPFAVVVKGGNKIMKSFVGDTPGYADTMFESTLRQEKPDYAVYASDSYLTVEGVKYDAVLIKAYDKNDSEVYLVGQRFKPKSEEEEFEKIGYPSFLGTTENSFSPQSPGPGMETVKKPWWKLW